MEFLAPGFGLVYCDRWVENLSLCLFLCNSVFQLNKYLKQLLKN